MNRYIYRIEERSTWEEAIQRGFLRGELSSDGFIHCSELHTVLRPANALFKGRNTLLLLEIDSTKVSADIVYEDLYNANQVFPHIYGVLPVDAVVRVVDFPPLPDGSFSLPRILQEL